jgi:hypothetical protein
MSQSPAGLSLAVEIKTVESWSLGVLENGVLERVRVGEGETDEPLALLHSPSPRTGCSKGKRDGKRERVERVESISGFMV